MKIIAFISSNRGEKSNTYKVINILIENLKKKTNYEISAEIFTSKDLNFKYCNGCNFCFSNAHCVLDGQDDVEMLQKKMFNSDLVILGSPIYAHGVSGQMKTFIDRSSYFLHIMRLAGKRSIVITTNDANGHDSGRYYLAQMLIAMGTSLIGTYNIANGYPNELRNPIWMDKWKTDVTEKIIEAFKSPCSSDENLEAIFSNLKKVMKKRRESQQKNGELKYWEKTDMINSATFADYLKKIQKMEK